MPPNRCTARVSAHLVFTKLVVDDLDTQADFYAVVLGQVMKHRFSDGEGDGAFEEIVLGSAQAEGPSLLLIHYPHRETPQPGEAVIGFVVPGVDQAVRAVEAAGGVIRSRPKSLPQQSVRVAQVEDLESHRLEFIQQL